MVWHLPTPIALLFMVRNIKVGHSFFLVRQAEDFETKFEQTMKFSVSQQNHIIYSNSNQGTLLCMSLNGLGIKQLFHDCL